MNRIKHTFKNKKKRIIPFITAGYPHLDSTVELVLAADEAKVDMIEIGMPFSDPQADGPIIQHSSKIALENGITIKLIFEQVSKIRETSNIPIALMGYYNPILKMGIDKFVENCIKSQVDGLILPDLPLDEAQPFCEVLRNNNIIPILLVAPNTSNDRIKRISKISSGLIYAVSILGVTGSTSFSKEKLKSYLTRIRMNSSVPFIVGFGISTEEDVNWFNQYSDGAVIGSALIKKLMNSNNSTKTLKSFIKDIKG